MDKQRNVYKKNEEIHKSSNPTNDKVMISSFFQQWGFIQQLSTVHIATKSWQLSLQVHLCHAGSPLYIDSIETQNAT